jgi:hypothetical protein
MSWYDLTNGLVKVAGSDRGAGRYARSRSGMWSWLAKRSGELSVLLRCQISGFRSPRSERELMCSVPGGPSCGHITWTAAVTDTGLSVRSSGIKMSAAVSLFLLGPHRPPRSRDNGSAHPGVSCGGESGVQSTCRRYQANPFYLASADPACVSLALFSSRSSFHDMEGRQRPPRSGFGHSDGATLLGALRGWGSTSALVPG